MALLDGVPAKAVDRGVVDEPVEPGPDRFRRRARGEGRMGLEIGVLDAIAGGVLAMNQAEREADELPLVGANRGLETGSQVPLGHRWAHAPVRTESALQL